jgi:hypothetical protein
MDILTQKELDMKKILKMANTMVETFEYQGFEELTLEDLRHIALETGQPFGIVAMLVYDQAYYD